MARMATDDCAHCLVTRMVSSAPALAETSRRSCSAMVIIVPPPAMVEFWPSMLPVCPPVMATPRSEQNAWMSSQYVLKSWLVSDVGRLSTNCAYCGAHPVVAMSLAINWTDSQADSRNPRAGISDNGSLHCAMASPLGRFTIATSTPNAAPATTSARGDPSLPLIRSAKSVSESFPGSFMRCSRFCW